MKVLQISGNYPPKICGVGDYTYQLSRHLADLGVEVSVITSSYNQVEAADSPVEVRPVMADWRLADRAALGREIERIKPDVIHLQYQTAIYREGTLAHTLKLRGLPVVATFHDYAGPKHLGKIGSALTVWLLGSSNRIVVTHDKPRKTFEKVGLLRRKLWQIPVGSNITRVEQPHPVKGVEVNGSTDPVLAYFGFVWRGKNIENLIRMVRTLLDENLPARLWVIGDITEADYHAELQKLAAECGVADRVTFTGALADRDISSLLGQATLGVFPYTNGATTGHGTLIAAVDHELPVVTTVDRSIDLSYFAHGQNVMLASLGNQDELVDGVRQLLRSPEKLETLRQNARQLAQDFSWATIARKHVELYQQVVKR